MIYIRLETFSAPSISKTFKVFGVYVFLSLVVGKLGSGCVRIMCGLDSTFKLPIQLAECSTTTTWGNYCEVPLHSRSTMMHSF